MKTKYTSFKQFLTLSAMIIFAVLSACDDEDPPLPDNVVQFESKALAFDADENTMTVNVSLSRAVNQDTDITILTTFTGLTYDEEVSTLPESSDNSLTVTIPKGASQGSFDIAKKEGVLLDGDETISFVVSNVGAGLVLGHRSTLVISFSEILAVQGSMDPNVGGQLQPNKVFIDLSASRQTSFNRGDWDLAFYAAEGHFDVLLNSSSSMMARALDKADLNAVTAADTIGWSLQLSTDAVFAAITADPVPAWVSNAAAWIDAPSGDMTATAIAEISMDAVQNKVYIVNRGKNPDGTQRGWKKMRVLRNGNNYTLQHADITSTSFTTVEITRDTDYLFNFVKFESGAVEIEPKKDKWDIAFTVFTNTTPAGPGLVVPYVFNDVVIQNRYATETAEILVSNGGSYDDFDESDLANVTFSTSQVNIGSKWRSGGGPGSGPALKEDRFYLVKDADGNIYKLKFTALTQNGERGRPKIHYSLIRKA
ncbi:HmuY family protein [Chryseolinea sp. H1M3-3]|uniref:HmuY family protein n=1 Tax=Chryseolinea sp. H1M3-3 TaxID=3034144 RepID=UPI0023EC67A5|nr:HmuY family protein [Chryseolinea sp. H1M3-3]